VAVICGIDYLARMLLILGWAVAEGVIGVLFASR
jgi:hypothetical protein